MRLIFCGKGRLCGPFSLRLKSKGLGSAKAGDQYVTLQIVTPTADGEVEKKFYRSM